MQGKAYTVVMNKKRVLIFYTGGTLGMDVQEPSGNLSLPDLSPAELKSRLLKRVPEIQDLAHCDVEIVCNRDSADVGPEVWLELAKRVRLNSKTKSKSYNGFVILHGTDTMVYTASALSFLLSAKTKQNEAVVLTGAQRPLSALRTDARRNLIAAVEAAAGAHDHGHSGVMLFFDRYLLQGNRARKRSATQFDAFESPKARPLGEVGTDFRWSKPIGVAKNKSRANLLRFVPAFSREVMMVHVTPGFPARLVRERLLEGVQGLVLVVFPSATAPSSDLEFMGLLDHAREKNIPIVAVSEGFGASPKRDAYAASKKLMKAGVHWAGDMTPECAYVKMCYILAQKNGVKKFGEYWPMDFAGEGV